MKPRPIKLPFGKHVPDAPPHDNPGTPYVLNVVPAAGFYRPFGSLEPISNALDARVQGVISGRDTSGNVYIFAGDAAKLYKMTAREFVDVSRSSGGGYSTSAGSQWEFVAWSDAHLIALNGVDAPQTINPQSGTEFAPLAGSPPAARRGAVVRSFVFLGNWADNETSIAWSAIDNVETWNTTGENQSDRDVIPSGGAVQKIIGGEVATVFCQTAIHRYTYVGSPVIFERDEIGPNVGLLAPGAVAQFGSTIFFVGNNSFYALGGDGVIKTIGEGRWTKTFFSELDESFSDRITSAIDPINTIWVVAYTKRGSMNGRPNRLFLYNWATDDCSFVDIDTDFVFGGFAPGLTLDSLTAETGFSLDDLPFSLDSRVWQGGALVLGGFTRDNKLGFFSGAPLEARMRTQERDGEGRRVFVTGVRPLVNADEAQVMLGCRETQGAARKTVGPNTIGWDGLAPFTNSTRFVDAEIVIPAGVRWGRARGAEVYWQPDGER